MTDESPKASVRAKMFAVRNALTDAERATMDAAICERICESDAFRNAETVFTYLSFGAEVDTRAIIQAAWDAGKVVALPRCTGPSIMTWYRVDDLDGLERSSFGVDEPSEDPSREVKPAAARNAIALVPALAFDPAGYRLGYGGGFYDVFLSDFHGISIGLCRTAQFVDSLDDLGVIEPHDRSVDMVATDCGWPKERREA